MSDNESKKYLHIYIVIYIFIYAVTFVVKSLVAHAVGSSAAVFEFTLLSLTSSAFSAIGPAIAVIALFNSSIWHWPLVRKICLIHRPYIAGRWDGYLKSSHTNYERKTAIAIEITQSFNKVVVWYYDENAVTHSIIADLTLAAEGGPPQLLCIYENNPIVNHDPGLIKHIGIMDLFVFSNETSIKGTYFNNPLQKSTYGEIELRFSSRRRRKCFQ